MATGDIVIVYAYLDTLSDKCLTVADMLADTSEMTRLSFPNNPKVTSSFDDFLDEWDKHRSKLEESVRVAGEAIKAVSDTFAQTEEELVCALDGGD